MTDRDRWVRNERLLGQLDFAVRQRFEDVVKGMEARGWKPLVVETRRSKARQAWLLLKRATRTLRSKHLTGRAMDVIDGRWKWADVPVEFMVCLAFQAQEHGLSTGLLWGLKDQVLVARQLYLARKDRDRLVRLITAARGWDPLHIQVDT